MAITFIRHIPTVEEIQADQPLRDDLKTAKLARDREISDVFTRKDRRFILIIGPCSAHDEDAVCEYVARAAALQEKVKEKILIIPRIYTNKPRTTGVGYKGMLHQPDHQKSPDISRGIKAIRHMHLRAIAESGITAADEMLYPGNYSYLEDVLAYVAIGARSVENQEHRLTVSGLDIPIGMKNPTSGDLKVMLDSIKAAQEPHVFIYNGWEVSTEGNTLAHAVLRGSVDKLGTHIPNYHYEDLSDLAEKYRKRDLANPSIIVDTNHSNSGKNFREQPRIAKEIIRSRNQSLAIREIVVGLMIESYLLEGAQDPEGDDFGRSITDPCLGWEDSERLVMEIAELLG